MSLNREEVFIVGGGHSLHNFNFEKLRNKETIAVNMAALDVPDPTYCITADSGIFRKLQKGTFKEVDSTWVLVSNPNHASMKWKQGKFIHNSGFVYNFFVPNMVIRNSGTDGIGFSFNDFRTGYNSGFCAFQLAVLLGYKKIYLLGFDLVAEMGETHYHDRYKNRKISNDTLNKFCSNFVYALKIIREKTDIEVFSCSAISKLNKHIPYKSFDKVTTPEKETPCLFPMNEIDESPKKLSILICSIKGRERSLDILLQTLRKQKTNDVEILVEVDNKRITTGEKRNILLKKAKGDYIAFIDDDDMVSEDYISKILKAIESKPDCCSIEGTVRFKRKGTQKRFLHSMQFKSWFTANDIYYRCPNHISPVKRELALKTGFPNISVEEDKAFSLKLLPLLKTEEVIKGPIYFYITG